MRLSHQAGLCSGREDAGPRSQAQALWQHRVLGMLFLLHLLAKWRIRFCLGVFLSGLAAEVGNACLLPESLDLHLPAHVGGRFSQFCETVLSRGEIAGGCVVDSCGEENGNHPVAGAVTAIREAPSVPFLPLTEKTLGPAFPGSQLSELRGSVCDLH